MTPGSAVRPRNFLVAQFHVVFSAILKAINSPFQEGMTFCRSTYVKKVMKLLAFIFEQSS